MKNFCFHCFIEDPYIAKRRTANHPCPVCGKHYVNEGSLRKHLACHPETAQLATSLRMWPCSVCQAVFTHESGTEKYKFEERKNKREINEKKFYTKIFFALRRRRNCEESEEEQTKNLRSPR